MRAVAVLVLAGLTTTATWARADDTPEPPTPVPLRVVARPLTLPTGVLRGSLGLAYLRVGSADGAAAVLAGGYGITDDLEIDATLLPLPLAPTFRYGNPSLSGTYRFVREQRVEIGGSLGATIITHDTALFGALVLAPSVPVLVRLGESARIDTGVALPITVGGGPPARASLAVPVAATFQVVDPIALGATTAFGIQDLGHTSDTVVVPFGVFGAYTIARPLVEIRPSFVFPALFVPGGVGDHVHTDAWQLELTGTLFWPLVATPVAQPAAPSEPKTTLEEDPAMTCYRNVRAPITDSQGVVHSESLHVQLGLAAGIQYAQLCPAGTNICQAPAYDCAGVFYDAGGHPVKVPELPKSASTDADVKVWKESVRAFYDNAYTDPSAKQRLTPGKAALCSRWAEINSMAQPDPSVVQAYSMLQQVGAESAYRQDRKWQTAIFAAGTANGCPTPALPPQHDIESWFVPTEAAPAFHQNFRNCNQPDPNHVGGCPHAFDAPNGSGNHVNDRHILDATNGSTQASWFVGDE